MHVLTRYLTIIYAARFGFLLIGITVFILSLDLVTNAEKVAAQSDGDVLAVGRYAALRLPQILSDTIKFASLFAALLTLTSLMRHNQIVPIWGGGVSQFGVISRLLPVAVFIGVFQFALDDSLVPKSNAALQAWGVVKQDPVQDQNAHAATSAAWLKVDNDIVRIPNGMAQRKTIRNFVIFQRNEAGRLMARLDVSMAHRNDVGWTLEGVTRRHISGALENIERIVAWGADFKPKDFDELAIHPRDLAFHRLFSFIAAEAHGAWPPHLYRTWLQVKLAVCFIPLLMIFLVVALSQRFQRTGRSELMFLGGLALGFAFFITNGIGLALGEVGLLPPAIAGWSPIAVFAAIIGTIAFSREVHDTSGERKSVDIP